MANDLVVQLGAKLDQFQSDMSRAGAIADGVVSRKLGGTICATQLPSRDSKKPDGIFALRPAGFKNVLLMKNPTR